MLPDEMYVKRAADDVAAFSFPFLLEGKALTMGDGAQVTEDSEGDLIIEGWAADFDGIDRQGENFEPGAFQRGIKSFLSGTASLNYHHDHKTVLGKVLSLEEKETPERKGLWMRARVDHQPKQSPIRHLYEQVKKGTLSGLSVGGFFKRVLRPSGYRIGDVDFTEISITNVPVHSRPSFAVVGGKALATLDTDIIEQGEEEFTPEQIAGLEEALGRLKAVYAEKKALPDSHDPQAAHHVARIIEHVARAREYSTLLREMSDHDQVKNLSDRIETQGSEWEAEAHRLAAVVGPLPPQGGGL